MGNGDYRYGGNNAAKMTNVMGSSGVKKLGRPQRKYDKKKKKVVARRRAPYNTKTFGE